MTSSERITLQSGESSAVITTQGAALRAFCIDGENVIVGRDEPDEASACNAYLGAVVGRVCNRTPMGRITVEGRDYTLSLNEPKNHLHGGIGGISGKIWDVIEKSANTLALQCFCADGEDGYPGDFIAEAHYELRGNNLTLRLSARTSKPCPICLTGHAYFNLDGDSAQTDVLNHLVRINASSYSEIDENMNRTRVSDVCGTPFDFRTPHRVGERIGEKNRQLELAGGYDHSFTLCGDNPAAEVAGKRFALSLCTDLPCLQFYTGNFLVGNELQPRRGLCLEPQYHIGFASRGERVFTPEKPFSAFISYTVTPIK